MESLWLRAGIALIFTVGVPIAITNFLLPSDPEKGAGKGVFTDVLGIGWLGFALVWFGIAASYTGPLVADEAERLETDGYGTVAIVVDAVMGDTHAPAPTEPKTTDAVVATQDAGRRDGVNGVDASSPDAGVDATEQTETEEVVGKDDELTPSEIFQKMKPGVVTIEVEKSVGPHKGRSGGTGFIIDDMGTVVTNYHVVFPLGETIEITLHDGIKSTEVEYLAGDRKLDLALLRIEPPDDLVSLRLGDSSEVAVGEHVVAIGNPLGLDYTLTDGLVSARRIWQGRKMIQISVPVSPGNSGGPLFNSKGHVVGVNTAALGNAFNRGQNLNLAVPINELKEQVLRDDYPNARAYGDVEDGRGSW